jgi:hypothetical protein
MNASFGTAWVCRRRAVMLLDWPLFYISFVLAFRCAAPVTPRITFG